MSEKISDLEDEGEHSSTDSQENFDRFIEGMRDGGRNDKKDLVRGMVRDWPRDEWQAALRFLSGEYTDVGVGKQSAIDAVEMYSIVDDFEAKVEEHGTVTEALREANTDATYVNTFGTELDDETSLSNLEAYIQDVVSETSGDDQVAKVGEAIMSHDQPHIVTFALLDDWQTGVTETTIANALGEQVGADSDDIQRARSLEPDPVVFAQAVEEDRFSDLLVPRTGKKFKPMKAKSESHLDKLLGKSVPIYAEPKLDGYRMLVHVEDGDVTAFTRRLKDATASVPELQEIDWPDGEWIIDGEVLADDGSYTTTSEMVGSNQERDMGDRSENVTFHAFDLLLHADEGDESRRRYEKRRAGLVLLSREIDSPYFDVVRAFGFDGDTDDPVADALDYAESNDLEGIIVKNGAAEYQFGKRSVDWCKKKLTEVTVDLVISDFERGEGSNAGTLGGVRLETADGRYVGNMGTGFTDEERDELWDNRDEYMGSAVEVTFEGLGTNDELRFPRMERLRLDDGEPDDFDRLKDLAEQV